MRLGASRLVWQTNEVPRVTWSLRNVGTRDLLSVAAGQQYAKMEVDSVWHEWGIPGGAMLPDLPPGQSLEDQSVALGPIWAKANPDNLEWKGGGGRTFSRDREATPLVLSPGTHRVRISVILEPTRWGSGDGFRVISPPLELTMEPPPEGATADWPPKPGVARAAQNALVSAISVLQSGSGMRGEDWKGRVERAVERAQLAVDVSKGSAIHEPAVRLAEALEAWELAAGRNSLGAETEWRAAWEAYRTLMDMLTNGPAGP